MKNSEGSTLVFTGIVTFFVALFVISAGNSRLLLLLVTTVGAVSIVRLRQRVKKLEQQVEALTRKAETGQNGPCDVT